MVELFPNIDHMPLPGKALCPPEHIDAALAQVQSRFRRADEGPEPGRRRTAPVV